MRKQLFLGLGVSALVAALLVSSSWSQQSNYGGDAQPQSRTVSDLFNPFQTVDDERGESANRLAAIRADIQKIMQNLQHAEDPAAKEDLVKKLDAAIADQFEEDLKMREAAVSALEQRLDKLRNQLARRRKAKAEITQLHAQVLINEAEGLGFSAGPAVTLSDFGSDPFGSATDAPATR